MITVGIDAGSRTTKLVMWDSDSHSVLYGKYMDTGIHPAQSAALLLLGACQQTGIPEEKIQAIYATGYSRAMIPRALKCVSEITAHARGIAHLFPQARTIIDVGGQDSKVISMLNGGKVVDFAMNDKCAAGTGRFLEVAANIVHTDIRDLSVLAGKAELQLDINSVCVVFAESEIIGLLSQGYQTSTIIRAVHRTIAKRLVNLASQLRWQEPVVFTGGVARNTDIVQLCAKEMGIDSILIPKEPTLTAALGAALMVAHDKGGEDV